jgi:hypothetical protein
VAKEEKLSLKSHIALTTKEKVERNINTQGRKIQNND